jgi:acyl-coenzyme A synthetase/AMP-(fatty) acid ligase
MKPQQLATLISVLRLFKVQICTQYGMTECNTALGCQLLGTDDTTVPIGYSLPGYRCLLIDEEGQTISNTSNSNEIGQIHIGGQESSF